jgi:hypothetical protein
MLILLLIPLAASLALFTYLRLEPKASRRWVPMLCRAVAWGGLGALLANPGCPGPTDARPPVVLLDASLSMTARPGPWQSAEDTARALGRVRWFGDTRPWTDSIPGRGRSELGPTLASAAATGRRIVVVTDGELDDVQDIPAELLASTGIVALPRERARDLAIVQVGAPAQATVGDTITVRADVQLTEANAPESVTVVLTSGARVLSRATATVAPGATVSIRVMAGTRGIAAGTQFLRIGIEGASDSEPRDDARLVAVEFSGTPGVVLLASPGDWDARFLFRTLREVVDLPVKGYVRLEGDNWRDMDGLGEVATGVVRAAARGADLLVVRGEARSLEEGTGARGVLRWPDAESSAAEWYAAAAPISPVAMAFLGVPVESLPPVTGARALEPGAGDWVGLSVQAGRRGIARPVILGHQAGRRREVTIGADGFWRWAFRGGPSADVYRAMIAAAVSWSLAEPDRGSAEARLIHRVVDQGLPLTFERTSDSTVSVPIAFEANGTPLLDTLRFGGDGRASLWLAPGIYRYRLSGPRGGSGTVAVDTWSREWLPQPVTVEAHEMPAAGPGERRTLRQWPWLYALVLLALAGEWLARRRLGLR